MLIFSDYLKKYIKQNKIRTVIFLSSTLLLSSFILLSPYILQRVLLQPPLWLWQVQLVVTLAIIIILYSYIRYVHMNILLKEQKQTFTYQYQTSTDVNPESLNNLFSDIKDSQFTFWNSLLIINGLLASIFLALIIIVIKDKILSITAFLLFLITSTIILKNFFVTYRIFSAMLYAINLAQKERDEFQKALGERGIEMRQNMHLAAFFVIMQIVFILYLILFKFTYT